MGGEGSENESYFVFTLSGDKWFKSAQKNKSKTKQSVQTGPEDVPILLHLTLGIDNLLSFFGLEALLKYLCSHC